MDMNASQAIRFLKHHNIEFTTREGFCNFWFTAICFKTRKEAWAAWKAMNLVGVGPTIQNEILFYQ